MASKSIKSDPSRDSERRDIDRPLRVLLRRAEWLRLKSSWNSISNLRWMRLMRHWKADPTKVFLWKVLSVVEREDVAGELKDCFSSQAITAIEYIRPCNSFLIFLKVCCCFSSSSSSSCSLNLSASALDPPSTFTNKLAGSPGRLGANGEAGRTAGSGGGDKVVWRRGRIEFWK